MRLLLKWLCAKNPIRDCQDWGKESRYQTLYDWCLEVLCVSSWLNLAGTVLDLRQLLLMPLFQDSSLAGKMAQILGAIQIIRDTLREKGSRQYLQKHMVEGVGQSVTWHFLPFSEHVISPFELSIPQKNVVIARMRGYKRGQKTSRIIWMVPNLHTFGSRYRAKLLLSIQFVIGPVLGPL